MDAGELASRQATRKNLALPACETRVHAGPLVREVHTERKG